MMSLVPYMAAEMRMHEMNPLEYRRKRQEDFEQKYKYVDDYYKSKHPWNSQTCKTCLRRKSIWEFKMAVIDEEQLALFANCKCCTEEQAGLIKDMGFMGRAMMLTIGLVFKLGRKNEGKTI